MAVFTAKNTNSLNSGEFAKVAANSLAAAQGTLLRLNGGFMEAADAGETIEGVSTQKKTFDSDNQTVDQDKVNYKPVRSSDTYFAEITWGTITQADVGKYFDINSSQQVDGTTESTTTGQVKMEEFISATLGVFSIVNL